MNLREELKSAGVYPTGPVSAWPENRNEELRNKAHGFISSKGKPKMRASARKMAGGLIKTAGQAIRHGKVSAETRKERYDTCKACPLFDPKSKRCTDCGCFMEAKTWVGGDPNTLCPKQKWSR